MLEMQEIFPDYYPDFSCSAERCQHNCCIGWEIDIDEETLLTYQNIGGCLGRRLQENISLDDTPHFNLLKNDRCPFLNERNLCDLILELGEDHLCQICTDHPRFRNFLPDRVEIGVGLCCEEAGRLILGKKEPVKLLGSNSFTDDEIILLRDQVILILQDRSMPISARIEEMLHLCGAELPNKSLAEWSDFFMHLERLNEDWTELLELMQSSEIGHAGFNAHMKDRQTEYEQLLVYLVYRHMANAIDEIDLASRAAFAALGYLIVYSLGAILWTKNQSFTFEDQVELARQFSSEIEYSEENTDAILDALVVIK